MTDMPPRILITGATGQVGTYLARTMKNTGACLLVGGPGDLDIKTLDLADPDAIRTLITEANPNIIINTAAYTAVDRAESESELAFTVNADAPGILSEEAKKLSALFIHFSTDYVFPGTGDQPWTEDASTQPVNEYGKSKLAGEQAVIKANPDAIIFRTSWVVSDHGHNFVKTMLKLGREREELHVIDDQRGAPASAKTLAELTNQVVLQFLAGDSSWLAKHAGIYHVTSQGETSWYGIAKRVFDTASRLGDPIKATKIEPIATTEYPTPAKRPLNSRLDCSKFCKTFDLQPPEWKVAIDEIVVEFLKQKAL